MATQTMSMMNNARSLLRVGMGLPLLVLALMSMVILPLPPMLLDALFTFNISLSLVVILAVVYVMRPLDLAVFPTVLLLATLMRLALNVASTRVVLLDGHTGTDAAGKVIEAFGEFVIGGNYAVGLIVFSILVIINFVVVTKGAGRVSEVSARFTLDASARQTDGHRCRSQCRHHQSGRSAGTAKRSPRGSGLLWRHGRRQQVRQG